MVHVEPPASASSSGVSLCPSRRWLRPRPPRLWRRVGRWRRIFRPPARSRAISDRAAARPARRSSGWSGLGWVPVVVADEVDRDAEKHGHVEPLSLLGGGVSAEAPRVAEEGQDEHDVLAHESMSSWLAAIRHHLSRPPGLLWRGFRSSAGMASSK